MEAHELTVVSSSLAELESKNLETVNLGQHVLAEFFECDPNILNNSDKVEKYMIDAALECGATIVQKCFCLIPLKLIICPFLLMILILGVQMKLHYLILFQLLVFL